MGGKLACGSCRSFTLDDVTLNIFDYTVNSVIKIRDDRNDYDRFISENIDPILERPTIIQIDIEVL